MGYGTLFISHHDDDTYFIMLMLVYVHAEKKTTVNSCRIPQSLILLRKIILSNLIMACRANHNMNRDSVNCVDHFRIGTLCILDGAICNNDLNVGF